MLNGIKTLNAVLPAYKNPILMFLLIAATA